MVGMLLHDIGKGKGHGHVARGIPLIQELTARIGLPPEDAERGDPPRGASPHACPTSPSGATSTTPKTVASRSPRWWGIPTGCACSTSSPSPTCARWGRGDDAAGWRAFSGRCTRARWPRLTGGKLERPSREAVAERVSGGRPADRACASRAPTLAMMSERYLVTTSRPAHRRPPPAGASGWRRAWCATELFHHPTSAPPSWSS